MSYSEIKPEYYRMFQPDSPWHAGAPGWKDAPWPGWGRNPNLVGPPRLGVEGLGAYYAPEYERAINGLGAYYAPEYERAISGLGSSGCGCQGAKGTGDVIADQSVGSPGKNIALYGSLAVMVGFACLLYTSHGDKHRS